MSSAAKHYLVTGGSGFLGANLVTALVQRGDRVRVLDNNFRGSKEKLGDTLERVEFIEADIRDADAVREATRGVDIVCHLAFINGTKYFYEMPTEVLDVGIAGTMNTLRACLECGVQEYVFASSSEVYQTAPQVPTDESVPMSIPDPLNPRYCYAGAKLVGELLSFNYGRERLARTVVFRPHNVYGADMGFEHVIPEFIIRLRRAAREQPEGVIDFTIQGDGSERRAFNYIEDFIAGLLLVIDQGQDQNVYHIGTPEEVTVQTLANTIAADMGRDIRIQPTALRQGSTARRCPDVGKIRELGYQPRFSLAEGLRPTIEWYSNWADHNG